MSFSLVAAFGEWDLYLTALCARARPPTARGGSECRANNLQPKRKQLSIVFATVDGTKQGVRRAEGKQSVKATADDYAPAAEGRERNKGENKEHRKRAARTRARRKTSYRHKAMHHLTYKQFMI